MNEPLPFIKSVAKQIYPPRYSIVGVNTRLSRGIQQQVCYDVIIGLSVIYCPLDMSYSHSRYETRRRQTKTTSSRTWGHWVPLAITVTVATAGIAAWIWNERKKDDDEDDYPLQGPPPQGPPPGGLGGPPPGPGYGPGPPYREDFAPPPGGFPNAPPTGYSSAPPEQPPYAAALEQRAVEDEGLVSRVSGALQRTPSPQQIIDGASRRIVAGVTAAGAAVGSALASITEEDKGAYEDHSRWSEEADSQNGKSRKGPELRDAEAEAVVRRSQGSIKSSGKKRTVAIVISAETDHEYEEDAGYHQEHAVRMRRSPVSRAFR